jgi:hypothetical protein
VIALIERYEGIGDNVVLSHFDDGIIDAVLRSYSSLRRGARTPNQEPSKVILAALLGLLEGLAAGMAPDRIEGVSGESEWASKAATESAGG